MIHLHWLVCHLLYGFRSRAVVVAHMRAVVYIIVVDDGGLMVVCLVVRRSSPIANAIGTIHIFGTHKYPPADGDIHRHAKAHAWSQWRPAAVAAAKPPCNPGGSPLITGDPYPAIVGIVHPAAIVVARPAPWVIRHPGVAVIRHHPVTAAAVGPEIATLVGHPNVAVLRVAHPFAIGR
jgi:hypothetical protein